MWTSETSGHRNVVFVLARASSGRDGQLVDAVLAEVQLVNRHGDVEGLRDAGDELGELLGVLAADRLAGGALDVVALLGEGVDGGAGVERGPHPQVDVGVGDRLLAVVGHRARHGHRVPLGGGAGAERVDSDGHRSRAGGSLRGLLPRRVRRRRGGQLEESGQQGRTGEQCPGAPQPPAGR
jgi:hypothetical protein